MHSPDRKPSELGYALLTYMTLVIVAITLIPFEFKVPGRIHINLHGSVSDAGVEPVHGGRPVWRCHLSASAGGRQAAEGLGIALHQLNVEGVAFFESEAQVMQAEIKDG